MASSRNAIARPKPPLRECVDGCGTKRYRWKDFVCRTCVERRIADPPQALVDRRKSRNGDRVPVETPGYDAAADPFHGLDAFGASVGLIGGATLLLDVEGLALNEDISLSPAPQQLSLEDWTLE
jgi:hypothetical protein